MPSKSKAQQRFFGMVRAYQKGDLKHPTKAIRDAAEDMSVKDVKKFAKTKHKGLPERVKVNEGELRYIVESIIGKILNEGAWGYDPDQNDGTLDLRSEIMLGICELVYDKCSDLNDTDDAWEELGAIEFFFEEFTKMEDFGIGEEKFDNYYYWWWLIEKKNKNIVTLYEKLLDKCKDDEEWINEWSDPKKMRKSLKQRQKVLGEWKQLLSDRIDHEKKLKKINNTDKIGEISSTKDNK